MLYLNVIIISPTGFSGAELAFAAFVTEVKYVCATGEILHLSAERESAERVDVCGKGINTGSTGGINSHFRCHVQQNESWPAQEQQRRQ